MAVLDLVLHITNALMLATLYRQYSEIRILLQDFKHTQYLPIQHDATDAGWTQTKEDLSVQYVMNIMSVGSSVFCMGHNHTTRLCHFQDMCYLPIYDEFVFFHSPKSVIEGVPSDRFSPTLLDMSSVSDHNARYFNFVDIPAANGFDLLQDVQVIETPALMFQRFNPSNIMHVFHDDLLPLFHTLQLTTLHQRSSNGERYNIQVIFMDHTDNEAFTELYALFSKYPPITKQSLINGNKPVCFKDVHVGVSKKTTWYDYGFFIPQGPISHSKVNGVDIQRFTAYIRKQYEIPTFENNMSLVVLLTRKHNRLILNEIKLCSALAQSLKMKVITLNLETHPVDEIIAVLWRTKILIGMHGSLLVLSMFLPQDAILVELFPYGIDPEHYTPYKTLCNLPGMRISYASWRNMDRNKSVTHPSNKWQYGGISHLSREKQSQIDSSSTVPLHLCCTDPEWLYRIYQDTIVNIQEVIALLQLHLFSFNTCKTKSFCQNVTL